MRYDPVDYIYACAQKPMNSRLYLPHGAKKSNEETENKKTDMLRRNGPVIKSVDSVLRPEGSLWLETLWKRYRS